MTLNREDLLDAYAAALDAVDPFAAVANAVHFDESRLTVGDHSFNGVSLEDIAIVAIGKAAVAMARGVYSVLGTSRGVVATPHPGDSPFPVHVGSHPIPTAASIACGEELARFVSQTGPGDVVVYLISGGGSAAAALPVEGVTTEDLAEMNLVLVASGLPIEDVNEIRSSVSLIKGGRLSALSGADRSVTLVLSDVAGVGVEHVASGPSIGFGLGFRASAVVDESGLRRSIPERVLSAIDRQHPVVRPTQVLHTTVGSPAIAARAAEEHFKSLGAIAQVVTTELSGDARVEAIKLVESTRPGAVAIAAGETTVAVVGNGLGGRCQEAALAVAVAFGGRGVLFGAFGTDGIDGPTPAAGAVVDGSTAEAAAMRGLDLEVAMAENDSHRVLHELDATVVTGPSGTNVADLWIAVRSPGLD